MKIQSPAGWFLIVLLSLGGLSCRSAEYDAANAAKNTSAPRTPERKLDDFEERLNSVQTGGYDFVLVFRRKDGAVWASEDKRFLKDNSPRETNRWDLTEDGKTVIAGTNYKFPPESVEKLKTRFDVGDYSPEKPEAGNVNQANSPIPNSRQ